jgi:hypothetical protein
MRELAIGQQFSKKAIEDLRGERDDQVTRFRIERAVYRESRSMIAKDLMHMYRNNALTLQEFADRHARCAMIISEQLKSENTGCLRGTPPRHTVPADDRAAQEQAVPEDVPPAERTRARRLFHP